MFSLDVLCTSSHQEMPDCVVLTLLCLYVPCVSFGLPVNTEDDRDDGLVLKLRWG